MMTTSVLGRDPFGSQKAGVAASAVEAASMEASTGETSAGETSAGGPIESPPKTKPSPQKRAKTKVKATAAATKKRTKGTRSGQGTTRSKLASVSKKAVTSVVREAQAALDSQGKREVSAGGHSVRPTEPLTFDPAAGDFDLFGHDAVYSQRVQHYLDFLYQEYFRVSLFHAQRVPNAGRALLVANHAGTLPYDAVMLMTGLKTEHKRHRLVRPLIQDRLWHFPYLGVFLSRIGGVRANQENAERLLRDDNVAAVFPEGKLGGGKLYKDRYKLRRFGRGGFVKLAMRTRSPIIPTAIVGAEEIHPLMTKITWLVKSLGIPYLPITPTFPLLGPLGILPLPSKWTISLGEPIDMSSYGPEDAKDLALVNKINEQVRQTVQDMLNNLLEHRNSILFG